MKDIRIDIALTGASSGYVIAVLPAPEGLHSGPRLVVGAVRDLSAYRQPQGEPRTGPEEWQAWLYPVAGGAMHVTRSCEGATAGSSDALEARLRKRLAKNGAWWN